MVNPTKFKNNPFKKEWLARDFFHSPDGIKEFPKHHCKMTWEVSKPFIKSFDGNAIDIGCRDGEYSRYLHAYFNHTYSFDMNMKRCLAIM